MYTHVAHRSHKSLKISGCLVLIRKTVGIPRRLNFEITKLPKTCYFALSSEKSQKTGIGSVHESLKWELLHHQAVSIAAFADAHFHRSLKQYRENEYGLGFDFAIQISGS